MKIVREVTASPGGWRVEVEVGAYNNGEAIFETFYLPAVPGESSEEFQARVRDMVRPALQNVDLDTAPEGPGERLARLRDMRDRWQFLEALLTDAQSFGLPAGIIATLTLRRDGALQRYERALMGLPSPPEE